MHSYSHRLRDLSRSTKVHTILTHNQCQYWPDYVYPTTNLSRASTDLGVVTVRAPVSCTAKTWAHPCFTYLPNPPAHITLRYKESMAHPEATDTHIFILHHIRNRRHLATYHIHRASHRLANGVTHGQDQTQAIRRAVTAALNTTVPHLSPSHLILWLLYTRACERELTHLLPLSNASESCTLITTHLDLADHHTFHLRSFHRKWPGSPDNEELRSLELEQYKPDPLDLALSDPKATMWGKIHADYRHNPRPSHITCDPPSDNIPPPAIRAAAKSTSRLISSTIFRWATNHCFDANYSDRFRQGANDHTLCPCADPTHPQYTPTHPYRPIQHT